MCDRHGGTHTTVCVYGLEGHLVESVLLLHLSLGFRVEPGSSGLHGQVILSTEPPQHHQNTFLIRVSLCDYKLSTLPWNWQFSCFSAPRAGIRGSDHFALWKPFLYSISDTKIMRFSPTNTHTSTDVLQFDLNTASARSHWEPAPDFCRVRVQSHHTVLSIIPDTHCKQ